MHSHQIVYYYVKTRLRQQEDLITGNSFLANRYGKCQTFQTFQKFVDLRQRWKRRASKSR